MQAGIQEFSILFLEGGQCSPPRTAGGQRASCGLKGHGAGKSHQSGAGSGEGVMFSKGFPLSRGGKL